MATNCGTALAVALMLSIWRRMPQLRRLPAPACIKWDGWWGVQIINSLGRTWHRWSGSLQLDENKVGAFWYVTVTALKYLKTKRKQLLLESYQTLRRCNMHAIHILTFCSVTSLGQSEIVFVCRPCTSWLLCLKKVKSTGTNIENKGQRLDGINNIMFIIMLPFRLLHSTPPAKCAVTLLDRKA